MSLSFEREMDREGTGGVFKKTVQRRPPTFDFAMKGARPTPVLGEQIVNHHNFAKPKRKQ